MRPPSGATYMHWGRDGLVPEPSNSTGGELCGVSNLTQTYGGAWGWSDTRCNISAPFMCRSMGGRPLGAAGTLASRRAGHQSALEQLRRKLESAASGQRADSSLQPGILIQFCPRRRLWPCARLHRAQHQRHLLPQHVARHTGPSRAGLRHQRRPSGCVLDAGRAGAYEGKATGHGVVAEIARPLLLAACGCSLDVGCFYISYYRLLWRGSTRAPATCCLCSTSSTGSAM